METSFDEIYCLNQLIRSDDRISSLSINDFYLVMWKYLQYSIANFQYDCKEDLNNYIPYSQTVYNFVCDGISNVFSLTPPPTQTDINFYICSRLGANEPYKQIQNYVYDSINYTITTEDTLPIQTEVIITSYEVGKFNFDLSLDEKRILSEGMVTPWLEEQVNEINLARFAIFGGSAKMHSQAEHLGKLDQRITNQYNLILRLINQYSYRTSQTNLKGLGGRYYAKSE